MRKTSITSLTCLFIAAFLFSTTHLMAASVGVEWINNFAGTGNDRSHWDESAEGLYDELTADGWYGKFHWANANAWESDFTTNNNSWIDSVDIALIGTHGGSDWDSYWGANHSSVVFSTGSSDSHMHPGEVMNCWGDNNLEWIALDCCSVLRDSSVGHWAHAMNGLHQLLGFKNTMYVSLPGDGKKWGQYMTGRWMFWFDFPFTITQSWFLAVDYVQPHGWTTVTARALAEVNNNYNDYAWGEGYVSSDPVKDGTYWIWDHNAACQPPRVNSYQETMMVYEAVEETITEADAKAVAQSLGLSGEIGLRDDGYYGLYDSPGDDTFFQIHKNGGLLYGKGSKLFTVPEEPPELLGEGAIPMANEFLSKIGLYPQDAGAPEFGTEMISEFSRDQDQKGESLQDIPILDWVYYPHEIGSRELIFSVVGPGSKLKVYLGDKGEVIGAVGGWRKLRESKEAEIISRVNAVLLMERHKHKVSLLGVPPFESFEAKEFTLVYYEEPNELGGASVFPVWLMAGTYHTGDARSPGSYEGDFFLPAVLEFIPPVVTIISPADGATFTPEDRIEFKAEVQFGAGAESIQWFSDIDGYLGEGDSIITSLSAADREGEVLTHSVKAVATDARGKVGTDIVSVNIANSGAGPWVYLTLNDTTYVQGDELLLAISGGNNSVARDVNLYVFLVTPDGRLLFWPTWTGFAWPFVLPFPAVFEIYDLPILNTTLPSMTPRIGARGNYRFWAFLTDFHTGELLGTISEVGFTML